GGDADGDGLPGLTRPFLQPFGNTTMGTLTPATTGPYTLADVAYAIRLTVTDSGGMVTNRTVIVYPNKVTLKMGSNPPGITLTLDGQPVPGGYKQFESVVGFRRTLGAPTTTQTLGPARYVFTSWTDGGPATDAISTPATNTVYVANFQGVS